MSDVIVPQSVTFTADAVDYSAYSKIELTASSGRGSHNSASAALRVWMWATSSSGSTILRMVWVHKESGLVIGHEDAACAVLTGDDEVRQSSDGASGLYAMSVSFTNSSTNILDLIPWAKHNGLELRAGITASASSPGNITGYFGPEDRI